MSHPFVISESTPVSHAGPLPEQADVVIIGGGVIGVTTAIYLARAGHDVVLLEKGRIAGEQSSRNWGYIRQQGRDPAELPIATEAIGRWKELAQETNVDFGLRNTGLAYVANTRGQMESFTRWADFAQAQGLDTRLLSQREAQAFFPGLKGPVVGAMHTPSDMQAEAWRAVPALAGIAVRAGVRIIERCAVRALDLAGGRVAGVMTESGRIATSQAVLAGGAWSALFLRNHGVSLPQLSLRGSVLATQPLPQMHASSVVTGRVAFRRRADGGYTLARPGAAGLFIGPDAFRHAPKYMPQLKKSPFTQHYLGPVPRGFPDCWFTPRRWDADARSPFEQTRVLNPAPGQRQLRRLVADFQAMYPDLPPIRPRATWGGMIDTMPDIVPVVDHCAEIPGLVIGTGMSGHGFGIGPGFGRILAALVTGDAVGHDLTRFRAQRFSDGSPIELDPIL